ncbi:MAG TPA: hypothetical protein PL096_08870 [Micropepsaceae bacterium]|nr:hypothetical protein [Micropepsaceae bacterium]
MRWRHIIGICGIAICVLSWVVLGVAWAMGPEPGSWTYFVVGAAIGTEIMFWCLAVMLGLTVFQARKRVWAWLMRRNA